MKRNRDHFWKFDMLLVNLDFFLDMEDTVYTKYKKYLLSVH